MRIRAAPVEHFEWLEERAACNISPDFRAIEALDAEGRIRGMVGYCDWTPNAVFLHIALESPMAARALWRPAFEYPFEEAGRNVLLATIRAKNYRVTRLLQHLEFTETACIRDGWADGEDFRVFEMRKENCRWLTGQRKVA